MGCWTAYVLRDADGTCWFSGVKWGDWDLTDEASRAEVIASVRRDGMPVEEVEPGYLDGWYCRGLAIDVPGRVYRVFVCPLKNHHHESVDLRVRSAPLWSGWDAGFAWGGREDLGEVVPEARQVIAPYDLWFRPLEELDFEESQWDECDLVTVVTPDRRVLDHRLARYYSGADTVLPWLVEGSGFVDVLLARDAHPVQVEGLVNAGVVIDMDRRAIAYWTPDYVPMRLLADIRTAWPGWELRRLPYGFAEHLAATGRRADDLLVTHGEAAPEWDAARRALRPDARPLRVTG